MLHFQQLVCLLVVAVACQNTGLLLQNAHHANACTHAENSSWPQKNEEWFDCRSSSKLQQGQSSAEQPRPA